MVGSSDIRRISLDQAPGSNKSIPQPPQQQNLGLGELLCAFFQDLGRFDVAGKGICIRLGRPVSRQELWGEARNTWRLTIQDPFNRAHDLGSALTPETQRQFFGEVQRAAMLLNPRRSADVFVSVVCSSEEPKVLDVLWDGTTWAQEAKAVAARYPSMRALVGASEAELAEVAVAGEGGAQKKRRLGPVVAGRLAALL